MTNLWSNPPSENYSPTGSTNTVGYSASSSTKACEQLAPERARSCRNAITMASVMIDEIRLRAHARPLDDPEP